MYKKIIAISAAVFIALSCTACKSSERDAEESAASNPTQASEAATSESGSEAPVFKGTATIERTVMVDEKNVKITAEALEYDDSSANLKLLIENNSEKELTFICGSKGFDCGSVNGYMVPGMYMNVCAAAGEAVRETVSVTKNNLMLYGISDIAEIAIGFDIHDEEYNAYFNTGPRTIETSIADTYDRSSDSFCSALRNERTGYTVDCCLNDIYSHESGIKVLTEAFVTLGSGDGLLMVETENTSSEELTAGIADIYLNGLLVKQGYGEYGTVSPGKKYVCTVTLSSLTDDIGAESFGLSDISDISFSVSAHTEDISKRFEPVKISLGLSEDKLSYDGSGTELYCENGVRIVSKGIFDEEYGSSVHIPLLAENSSDRDILLYTNSEYIILLNGKQARFYGDYVRLAPGEAAAIGINVFDYSLAENGIEGANDIDNAELAVEICDTDGKIIDEPVLKLEFTHIDNVGNDAVNNAAE